jgi:hypothetical protein
MVGDLVCAGLLQAGGGAGANASGILLGVVDSR